MSDFIFSKKSIPNGMLTKALQSIYHQDSPQVEEFHGQWGSLAVSKNLYNGFSPYESDRHIIIVIGGPVLCFCENDFLQTKESSFTGTKYIYDRWLEGNVQWDEDLSGPFAIFIIDKMNGEVLAVTDLLSFVPVYVFQENENIMISTHVDAVATAANQLHEIDPISQVDFILNGVITYPYTAYKNIRQVSPGSIHKLKQNSYQITSEYYWIPEEKCQYSTIDSAATDLRQAIETYIDRILKYTNNIAQFISGGEDSRTLSALLQSVPERNAIIFLDHMNREGKIAERAAKAYGANFQLYTRDGLHYLKILPACTDLVGSGAQYIHAHSFGFDKICGLDRYDAVFGGLFADALLKGARIKKIRGSKRFPFIPHIKDRFYSPENQLINDVFTPEALEEVRLRRKEHFERIQSFRQESAEEWFELWPSSMNLNIPNLHTNRRLFRSYEPFMDHTIVKISAGVPQKWKMNRRLFRVFAKPYLEPTKWLFHSEGRLPYFPWQMNMFVQFGFWVAQEFGRKIGIISGNQGPWVDWNALLSRKEWKNTLEEYESGLSALDSVLNKTELEQVYNHKHLNYLQRINLMQVLYKLQQIDNY